MRRYEAQFEKQWAAAGRVASMVGVRVRCQMDFDLADEYVEVFYRQFIIILGMTVFPAITALGAVAYIIEYAPWALALSQCLLP